MRCYSNNNTIFNNVEGFSSKASQALLLSELLKKCSRWKDLRTGQQAHSKAIHSGLIFNPRVVTSLINMYAKCGSMREARKLFDELPHPDVVCWNCLIHGYVNNDEAELALEIFDNALHSSRLKPNSRTYVAALTACSTLAVEKHNGNEVWLRRGMFLHSEAVRFSCCDIFVETRIIEFYAKCGKMFQARKVFDEMKERNVVSWTVLLQGYVENGESELALELFDRMKDTDARAFVVALTACVTLVTAKTSEIKRWLEKGREIHSKALMNRCCDLFVETVLVDLYGKCGAMELARGVFDKMIQRSIVSWTALLQGYVENQQAEAALEVFNTLVDSKACSPNHTTYSAALKACASLGAQKQGGDSKRLHWLMKGRSIHSQAFRSSCCNEFVENSLVDMYGKCGSTIDACIVFDNMISRSVLSWNSLLQGLVENNQSKIALDLFSSMELDPDARTYSVAISACASLAADDQKPDRKRHWLKLGEQLQSKAIENRCCDSFVDSALINMFARSGRISAAQVAFDKLSHRHLVSWNTLLHGYVENGENEEALKLYERMESESGGCAPDARTYLAALTACAALGGEAAAAGDETHKKNLLEKGESIHSKAVKTRSCDKFVENTMIHLYVRCGRMELAHRVLDSMVEPDTVSWTALITGYVHSGENTLALKLICCMDLEGVALDPETYLAALAACGSSMALQSGEMFHDEIRWRALEQDDPALASSLVEFYGKCGSMKLARDVFDSISDKTTLVWNSLMCAYSLQGESEHVLQVFEEMIEHGVCPSEVSYTHVLTACSHAGLTERAMEIFSGLEYPNVMHCNCVVDLLCRSGYGNEAFRFVVESGFEQNEVTWTTLVTAFWKTYLLEW